MEWLASAALERDSLRCKCLNVEFKNFLPESASLTAAVQGNLILIGRGFLGFKDPYEKCKWGMHKKLYIHLKPRILAADRLLPWQWVHPLSGNPLSTKQFWRSASSISCLNSPYCVVVVIVFVCCSTKTSIVNESICAFVWE